MGSSPLTRGKPDSTVGVERFDGLIPAHAGKTITNTHDRKRSRAHPRSRGENDGGFAWRANFPGSSPLTRGKLECLGCGVHVHGLIPAHAGKTAAPPSMAIRAGAHPRSRGENDQGPRWPHRPAGSSPLTRGKLTALISRPAGTRLIPAHAGKTSRPASAPPGQTAHPRSRGENTS